MFRSDRKKFTSVKKRKDAIYFRHISPITLERKETKNRLYCLVSGAFAAVAVFRHLTFSFSATCFKASSVVRLRPCGRSITEAWCRVVK